MLLSIIIPVYNVESYLSLCVKSLLDNCHSIYEYEVILVDDGSTDKSGIICDEFKAKYKNIKVIHKNNGGLSSARNAGIKIAKGEWISFIDSDDIVRQNYLDILFDLIKIIHADLIMFRYQSFEKKIDNKIIEFEKEKIKEIPISEAMYLLTTETWGNFAWNKIYKRKLFCNIKYPVNKNYEDIYTTFKLVEKAKKIYTYNEILYYYRQRVDSITSTLDLNKKRKNAWDSIQARANQISFFKEKHYDKAIKKASYYFVLSCLSYIVIIGEERDKTFYKTVDYLRKMQLSFKQYGIKTYLKVKLCVYCPNCYITIAKLKKYVLEKK